MSPRDSIIRWSAVLGVMLVGSCVALWQEVHRREARQRVMLLTRQAVDARDRLTALQAEVRRQASRLEDERRRNAADAARLKRDGLASELAAAAETWRTPPAHLPDWNPGSPFIWVNKTSLPSLGIRIFDSEGAMAPEFAAMIGLAPAEQRRIHDVVAKTLEEFHTRERTRAVVVDNDAAGHSAGTGDTLTVRVPAVSEEGGQFMSAVQSALLAELGEDRGRLVNGMAAGWLTTSFNPGGTEACSISVSRLPDGRFAVVVDSPSSKTSVSGADSPEAYIPRHLRPLFDSLLGVSGRSAPPP